MILILYYGITLLSLFLFIESKKIWTPSPTASPAPKRVYCEPGFKNTTGSGSKCVSLTNDDVYRSLHWLAEPPKTTCKKITTIQGISVCEDHLKPAGQCNIWSVISSTWCDHWGSLAFEKYWSERGCTVHLYHFTVFFKGNVCNNDKELIKYPNIKLLRNSMWAYKCYNCFYRFFEMPVDGVDFLKLQDREGVNEDYDGVQYTILSDFYQYLPFIINNIKQIGLRSSINSQTLIDSVGREAEMAWNMWGTQQLLVSFASFSTRIEKGRNQPFQFTELLSKINLDPSIGSYVHSLVRIDDSITVELNKRELATWKPNLTPPLQGIVPKYCVVPNEYENEKMQKWIDVEINARCHPTRLWVLCERTRKYDSFVPCEQDVRDLLADDYSATKGWCNFHDNSYADIQPLTKVDINASKTFQKVTEPKAGVRLAFFFTVYTDYPFMERILNILYSEDHYYLFHIDPTGSSVEFETQLRQLASKYTNVYLAKDVPIVYGASTATILLTRAMAWFLQYAKGWDYFVPLTGSDYPLLPLHRIEKIFAYQKSINPMPFVMAWTPGTSTHIFRLEKTHPIFEEDKLLALSIKAVTDERGKILGAVPMEYRSTNFGK